MQRETFSPFTLNMPERLYHTCRRRSVRNVRYIHYIHSLTNDSHLDRTLAEAISSHIHAYQSSTNMKHMRRHSKPTFYHSTIPPACNSVSKHASQHNPKKVMLNWYTTVARSPPIL